MHKPSVGAAIVRRPIRRCTHDRIVNRYIIIGAILYIIQLLPIDATIKNICYVVVVIFVLIWLLQMLGGLGTIKIGEGGQNLQNSALC